MAIRRTALAVVTLMTVFPFLAATFTIGHWEKQATPLNVNLRGLHVLGKGIAWASGAKGTVARTTNGKDWQVFSVPGAGDLDFRDIEAFDANNAIIMSSGPGKSSRFYRTSDGGANWSLLFTNSDPDGFFDCMAWWDQNNGIALGDPLNDRFGILTTSDGGRTWVEGKGPRIQSGEAAFAASGSCLIVRGDRVWFGTGGASIARVYQSRDRGKTWSFSDVAIIAETASSGIFSLSFCDNLHGVAVGGDYKTPEETRYTAAFTSDGGQTWFAAKKFPAGYRSAVSCVPNTQGKLVIAAGTNGSDFSTDFGNTWSPIDKADYNAISFAAGDGKRSYEGWAVGPNGMVAKYIGVD